jgi:hypothetical protein
MTIIQLNLGVDKRKAEEVEVVEARLSVVFDAISPWQKAVELDIVVLPYIHLFHLLKGLECSQYSQHWYWRTSTDPQQRSAAARSD